MQSSDKPEKVYKMSEEARAKNRERQRRWQLRKKLASGAFIAIDPPAANDEGSAPVAPPDAA